MLTIIKHLKKLRRNAWICGLVGVGVGTLFGMCAHNADSDELIGRYIIIGATGFVVGATYAGVCLIKANRLQKELDSYVHSTPIFQENIKLGNGNMLSAGLDILKSKNVGYTPGVGLRYNF